MEISRLEISTPIRFCIMAALFLGLIFSDIGCSSQNKRVDSPTRGNSQVIIRPVFYPKHNGPYPAILVLPEAGSLVSAHADDVARKLASEGYVAQAVSYGQKVSGKMLSDQDATNRIKHLISDRLNDLKHQAGVDSSRVGVIGYSLGGAFATQLASSTENGLRAVVVYYGIYRYPELFKTLKAPVLVLQGDADMFREFITNAFEMQRIALENGRQFDVIVYENAKHGFDFSPSGAFNAQAASDAWARTIAFLDRYLKPK